MESDIDVRTHPLAPDGTDGVIAEIVLNRPAAMNALSTAMLHALATACARVGADQSIRVVLLTAAGDRAFCVGADLKERAAMSDAQLLAQRPAFRHRVRRAARPAAARIAAVHGFALGGGCELALSCDIVVADETAVLGLPETRVGLVPGCGGTQLAARRIGPGRAAELVLTGRHVPAAEAERIGLADRLVPAGAAGRPRWSWPGRSPPTRPSRCAPPPGRCDWGTGSGWPPGWRSRTPPGGPRPPPPTAARASPPSWPAAPPPGRGPDHRRARRR